MAGHLPVVIHDREAMGCPGFFFERRSSATLCSIELRLTGDGQGIMKRGILLVLAAATPLKNSKRCGSAGHGGGALLSGNRIVHLTPEPYRG